MPKITTIIEYTLFEAIQIIHKTNFRVNGGLPAEKLHPDYITSIKYASKDKKSVIIEHKDKRYQIQLGSDVCLLMGSKL